MLKPGMYEGNRFEKGRFGLSLDQMAGGFLDDPDASSDINLNNARWFNHLGEKLGWGDICGRDVANIAKGLENKEFFFILPENHEEITCADDLKKDVRIIIVKDSVFYFPQRWNGVTWQMATRSGVVWLKMDRKVEIDHIFEMINEITGGK